MNLLEIGKSVVGEEIQSLQKLHERLNGDFIRAVEIILKHDGKVVFTGIGKSGYIAQKLASTFNSTGTRAVFLHPAEALHGDLGVYNPGDPTLLLSRSGSTEEVVRLLPLLKKFASPLIALVGNPCSALAQNADVFLDASITKEADPLGFIPTSSTVVALALGDALACALMVARGFQKDDFFRFHPAGQLGKNLGLHVGDLMCPLPKVAQVSPKTNLRQIVIAMTQKPLGAAFVFDKEKFIGLVTDGDVRRVLQTCKDIEVVNAEDFMTRHPISVYSNLNLGEAVRLMEERPSQLSVLPVLAHDTHACVGLLRLHDAYQAKMV